MDDIKLGFIVEDGFVELVVAKDLDIESPVIDVVDGLSEVLVLQGWPLKGLPNP